MDDHTAQTDDFFEESPIAYDSSTVDLIVKSFAEQEQDWIPAETLTLAENIKWRPHLISSDKKKIIHFHFSDNLRPYIVERLRAAKSVGLEVHLALPLAAMYDAEVVRIISDVDGQIQFVEGQQVGPPQHHLDAISSRQIPLDRPTRTSVAKANWQRRSEGTNHEKGKRLESLLAFLFEQVADFKVIERNLRGDSDEIDLVLQNTHWTSRCWNIPGVPFILVEAKNRLEPTGQPTVSLLIRRLQTKRGTTRIGLIFTSSKFTEDANLEVIKLAESQITVVLVDPTNFEKWIESATPDDYLEELVRKAMLR